MGFGGISIWQLLIVLLIVVLIFGTKRLSSMGGDIGAALRSFRKAVDDPDKEPDKLSDASKSERESSRESSHTRDI